MSDRPFPSGMLVFPNLTQLGCGQPWLREEAKKTVVDWTKKHSPFNF